MPMDLEKLALERLSRDVQDLRNRLAFESSRNVSALASIEKAIRATYASEADLENSFDEVIPGECQPISKAAPATKVGAFRSDEGRPLQPYDSAQKNMLAAQHEVGNPCEPQPEVDNPCQPGDSEDRPQKRVSQLRFSEVSASASLASASLPNVESRPTSEYHMINADTNGSSVDPQCATSESQMTSNKSWTPADDFNPWDMVKTTLGSKSLSAEVSNNSEARRASPMDRWRFLYDKFSLYCNSQVTILHPVWNDPNRNTVHTTTIDLTGSTRSSNEKEGPVTMNSFVAAYIFQGGMVRKLSSGRGDGALNFMARVYYRIASYVRPMHPYCKPRLAWDCFSVGVCLYDLIMWPLHLFELSSLLLDGHLEMMKYIELAFVIFWTVDMGMTCLTGYQAPEGYIERHLGKVVRRYVKTWFIMDAPLVVVDWYLFFNAVNESEQLFKSLKGVRRFLRVLRLSRLLRLIPKLQELVGELNSEYLLSLLGLFGSLFIILLLNHYIASSWCYYWDESHLVDKSDQIANRYLTGLHWALATSTLGNMDVYASTNFERLYTCLNISVALVVFSTFLSHITAATTRLGELRHRQIMKERAIRKYLQDYDIPRKLSCQVWKFVRHNNLTRDRIRENEVEVFDLLPSPLQDQLRYESVHKHLMAHPLFNYIDSTFPQLLRQICISGAHTLFMRPFFSMFWSAIDGVNRMIFVVSGSLEYRPEFGERCSANSGEWACEEILWCRTALLSGPLLAGDGGATLILIPPQEFQDVVRADKACSRIMRRYARAFVENFNKASLEDDDNLLFNDVGLLANMLAGAVEGEELPPPKKTSSFFRQSAFSHSS